MKLIFGNCLEELDKIPANSVDAVIADPPYSSGGLFLSHKSRSPKNKYLKTPKSKTMPDFSGDSRDQRSWTRWSVMWMDKCLEKLKDGGYLLSFTDWRQLPSTTDALQMAGAVWRGVIVWDKGPASRAPHKGYFRHQAEYITWGSKGSLPKATHAGPYPGVIRATVNPNDKLHITGKPIALMEELVRIVPPGGVVLDPFMGSGSTGLACKNLGREFIGIEKSPEYFEIAKRRLGL